MFTAFCEFSLSKFHCVARLQLQLQTSCLSRHKHASAVGEIIVRVECICVSSTARGDRVKAGLFWMRLGTAFWLRDISGAGQCVLTSFTDRVEYH
jgi:hypothetical protein